MIVAKPVIAMSANDAAIQTLSFRDGAQAPDPESRDSPMCNCTSEFDALHRPGMTAILV
jgi:hypothetical protein